MTQNAGFIYRLPRLDTAGVRALIARYVQSGSAFGGNIVTLDPLRNFGAANELDEMLETWDFGHAFSPAVEVRWRRIVPFDSKQPDIFDTLLLADTPIAGLTGGEELPGPWTLRPSGPDTHILLSNPGGAHLAYTRYLALNETVQFTRYMEAL